MMWVKIDGWQLIRVLFKEMNKNVERVKELLSTIKSQLGKLEAIASDSQKDALAKINDWTKDISAFQERVSKWMLIDY